MSCAHTWRSTVCLNLFLLTDFNILSNIVLHYYLPFTMSRATYAHWNANYVDFGCSDAVCSLGFIWSFRNSALRTTTGTRYTFVDSTTLQYRNTIPLQSNRFQSKLLAKFIKQNWKSFAENEIGFCCFRFPYIFFLRFFSIFLLFLQN